MIRALLAGVLSLLPLSVEALELYATDFEDFLVGPDQLVRTDGWLGTNTGQGVHGIDDGIVAGLGKTGFLGVRQPGSTFTRVFRPVDYDPVNDPVDEARPIIEFQSFIGIQDSTNLRRDRFFITFYNRSGKFLAALEFNNSQDAFGIWRLNGSSGTHTGDVFFRSEVMFVLVRIDFSANLWSVVIDDIPVFEDEVFNASGQALDLGGVAAEWQLTSPMTSMFGNNWMLFDHWAIYALPPGGQVPFVAELILDPERRPLLTWLGEPGFSYQVVYSDDLVNWLTDLPNSILTSIDSASPLSYTDVTASDPGSRSYKIIRFVE